MPVWWKQLKPALLLLLIGVVIPQLPFVAATLAGIGVPPRPLPIAGYLLAVILLRTGPAWIAVVAYLLVLAFDLAQTISLMFGLSVLEIAAALRYADNLDLLASPLYLTIIVAIGTVTLVALWLIVGRRAVLRRASATLPILVCLVVLGLDFWMRHTPHYQFGLAFAGDTPFESAVADTGFGTADDVRQRRDLLLVIVESIGVFADPVQRSLIEAPFGEPAVTARYDVTRGQTVFWGSTTAAEMRELCGTRRPYEDMMAGPAIRCLPALLADAGYATISVHAFTGAMFDRAQWYPHAGIAERVFGAAAGAPGASPCGAVFVGACDRDVAPRLAGKLAGAGRPTFLYWLTLNSHVPVDPKQSPGVFDCFGPANPFGYEQVCLMSELWAQVMSGVAALAVRPGLPPTEILIVGDHAPPLWSMRERDMFVPGIVPWIHLEPKVPG